MIEPRMCRLRGRIVLVDGGVCTCPDPHLGADLMTTCDICGWLNHTNDSTAPLSAHERLETGWVEATE